MIVVYYILHAIGKTGMFFTWFILLFLIQKFSIGQIPGFRKIIIFNRLYLYEIVFSLTSIAFIFRFIKIGSRWEDKIKSTP